MTAHLTQAPALLSLDDPDLKQVLTEAGERFHSSGPDEILDWLFANLGADFVVASSMSDAALIHLAARAAVRAGLSESEVKVLFLNTGYHFAETIGTRDAVEFEYGVSIVNAAHPDSVSEHEAQHGQLFQSDPDACCNLRKIVPLRRTLGQYSAWVTGIQRSESATRRNAAAIHFDNAYQLIKVNPIVNWTAEEKDQYMLDNDIIINPLVQEGYLSIGCEPCTSKVEEGADPRSGRWAAHGKTECGLHQ